MDAFYGPVFYNFFLQIKALFPLRRLQPFLVQKILMFIINLEKLIELMPNFSKNKSNISWIENVKLGFNYSMFDDTFFFVLTERLSIIFIANH